MKRYLTIISISVLGILLWSCSSSQEVATDNQKSDTKVSISDGYTTAYPQRDISKNLTRAKESTLRIISTSFYNSYTFDEPYLTLSDLSTNDPKDVATDYFSTEESTAGTAIILQNDGQNVMLITCDHVVSSPDTVVSYYEGSNIPSDTFVKAISIKRKQNNLIFTNQELFSFNVIASDRRYDLALLSTSLDNKSGLAQRSLNVRTGNSNDLVMGSLLYVLGYPRGYPMVTRGVASTSEFRSDHYFITDALFNPGISGGLVLASKDNFRSFEWVGMARSATASKEDVLVPQPADHYERAPKPYTDTPYVQSKNRISYGITQTIPIDTIKNFLEEHQQQISRNGFQYSVQN